MVQKGQKIESLDQKYLFLAEFSLAKLGGTPLPTLKENIFAICRIPVLQKVTRLSLSSWSPRQVHMPVFNAFLRLWWCNVPTILLHLAHYDQSPQWTQNLCVYSKFVTPSTPPSAPPCHFSPIGNADTTLSFSTNCCVVFYLGKYSQRNTEIFNGICH